MRLNALRLLAAYQVRLTRVDPGARETALRGRKVFGFQTRRSSSANSMVVHPCCYLLLGKPFATHNSYMRPPHNFPSLTDPQSNTKPVLLIGAGMSAGIAPMPPQFVKELAPRQQELEVRLGCSPLGINIDPNKVRTLYLWAGAIINALLQQQKSESQAKKELADALGITTDPRWRGRTKIPLRGNTPRHRVVARLAREGRWHALWSLNWDCVLETALESIGMPAHPGGPPLKKLPWVEWHQTWTQPERLPALDDDSTMFVIKPHGCAEKLANGDCATFKVTANELADIGMNLGQHKAVLSKHFSLQPLLTCGWSASEGYLRRWIRQLSKDHALPDNGADRVSIVDVKHGRRGHQVIIGRYGVDPADAQIEVQIDQCYTADELFLWIQTLYGLQQLKKLPNSPVAALDGLLGNMECPACNHWLNGWFDNFLPVWVRLCFNAGATRFFVNAAPVAFEAIPTDRRDEHIPWGYQDALRPDLQMATQLLLQLMEDSIGECWDTGRFPGGLWDKEKRRLILPLPYPQQDQPPSLPALKSTVDSHQWERTGEIMNLDILPLDQSGPITPTPEFAEALQHAVSKLMKHSRLADYNNIRIVDFSAFKEATV